MTYLMLQMIGALLIAAASGALLLWLVQMLWGRTVAPTRAKTLEYELEEARVDLIRQNGRVSSSAMFPAIRYAGRLVTDPAGALQAETSLIQGTGSQSGGYNRWGDYASMTIDPNDGCTFWFTTEYYATTSNNWQTRIGSFQFPGCAAVT